MPMMTPSDFAAEQAVSTRTVARWIKAGMSGVQRIGTARKPSYRIDPAKARRWLTKRSHT